MVIVPARDRGSNTVINPAKELADIEGPQVQDPPQEVADIKGGQVQDPAKEVAGKVVLESQEMLAAVNHADRKDLENQVVSLAARRMVTVWMRPLQSRRRLDFGQLPPRVKVARLVSHLAPVVTGINI